MFQHRIVSAVCLVATTLVSFEIGCSSSGQSQLPVQATQATNGQVKYDDGSPVTAGLVEFSPLDGGLPARASIGSDGRFSLSTIQDNGSITSGAKAGKYRVTVTPSSSEQRNSGQRNEVAISLSQQLTVLEGQNEFPVVVPKPR